MVFFFLILHLILLILGLFWVYFGFNLLLGVFFSYSAPNSAYFGFILGLIYCWVCVFLILHLILLILGLFWV